MCTALIAFQVFEEWPLFIASNRDEDRGRGFDAPQKETRNGRQVLSPRDRLAGGTWIGANDLPMVALLTNRTDLAPPDPSLRTRSRGLLVRDALGCSSVDEALDRVESSVELMSTSFNLVIGDAQALFAVERTPAALQLKRLEPGIHAIANGGRVDDRSVGEVAHALDLWFDIAPPGVDPWQVAPRLLSCDEARGDLPPICKRTLPRGTVCASMLGIHQSGSIRLDHTPSAPGEQPFERYTMEALG